MNFKELFLILGIQDVTAFLQFANATSKTGPVFKEKASVALTALTDLAAAAENPTV